MILYEYPLNERIRTYLRLEHLFDRLALLVTREHPIDHHYALATLFEVMDVAARADLKADVMKDIDRQRQTLAGYRGNPAIAEGVLDAVMRQLDHGFATLNALPGKVGQSLAENDWLMGIRSRIGIPGGTCEFDLPSYFHWQHRAPGLRRADLERWRATLSPLSDALVLLLRLLRDSGSPQKVVAQAGQYQQPLAQGRSYQLLRLAISPALGLIPEISANRLIVSIRFMRQDAEHRLLASGDDAGFELSLCA